MLFLNLSHKFGETQILNDIKVTFERASFTSIIGPNGAGKSTLLKIIAGLIRPSSGSFKLAENIKCAYLPQYNNLDHYFPLKVSDVAAMGFWPKIGLYQRLSADNQKRLHHALSMVGLTGYENDTISILSGGQFQRLLFARLWLQEADLLILDEPFSAIDQPTTEDLLLLLSQWLTSGKTIIAVIHQLHLAERHIPETILLNKKIIAKGASQIILNDADLIKKTYVESAA